MKNWAHGYENIAGVDQFFWGVGFPEQPVEMDPVVVVEGGQFACVFFSTRRQAGRLLFLFRLIANGHEMRRKR